MRYLNARRHERKAVMIVGVAISTGSLIASAFLGRSAAALVATQGALYGVGGALVYYSAQTCASGQRQTSADYTDIPEWFVARRGLSTGVCFAGTAVGGLILPFVLSGLLSATSSRNTLLIIVRITACAS